mmetsp:Transcript_99512/g.223097  ORF Transcript_99512/g.223097 Transcript_99512/m.223097 type:complete len:364 (-) Transcript_99512:689-1780(-)
MERTVLHRVEHPPWHRDHQLHSQERLAQVHSLLRRSRARRVRAVPLLRDVARRRQPLLRKLHPVRGQQHLHEGLSALQMRVRQWRQGVVGDGGDLADEPHPRGVAAPRGHHLLHLQVVGLAARAGRGCRRAWSPSVVHLHVRVLGAGLPRLQRVLPARGHGPPSPRPEEGARRHGLEEGLAELPVRHRGGGVALPRDPPEGCLGPAVGPDGGRAQGCSLGECLGDAERAHHVAALHQGGPGGRFCRTDHRGPQDQVRQGQRPLDAGGFAGLQAALDEALLDHAQALGRPGEEDRRRHGHLHQRLPLLDLRLGVFPRIAEDRPGVDHHVLPGELEPDRHRGLSPVHDVDAGHGREHQAVFLDLP